MKLVNRRLPMAVGGLWLLALTVGGPLIWTAAYGTALLLVLAWVWAVRIPIGLETGIFAERQQASAGDRVKVQIWIENRSPLPVPWLELHEEPAGTRAPLGDLHMAAGIGIADTCMHFLWLHTPRRGVYTVGPLRLRSGDPFGVFTVEWSASRAASVTVLPRVPVLQGLPLPLAQAFGHRRVRQRAFVDPSSLAAVREYRPGDSPRHIHWKAFAHSGALSVKEFDLLATTRLSIWLDARACPGLESGIETAAALLNLAVRERIEVELTAHAPHRLYLPPGKGARQLRRGLELLARAEAAPEVALQHIMAGAPAAGNPTLAVITGRMDEALAAWLLTRPNTALIVLVPGLEVPAAALRALAARFTVFRLQEGDPVESLPEQRLEVMPHVR